MTRDIGQERRSEFFRASKIAMDGGGGGVARATPPQCLSRLPQI